MTNQVESQVGQHQVAKDVATIHLWMIRYWHSELAFGTGPILTEPVSKLITEQEASLIESLRCGEPRVAHLVYADWLDDNGMANAAIAHRLAGEEFEWRKAGSHVCFFRNHVFGMHDGAHPLLPGTVRESFKPIMTWLVPVAEAGGAKIPHAEYAGRFDFRAAVHKIYEVSWQLRHYIPN